MSGKGKVVLLALSLLLLTLVLPERPATAAGNGQPEESVTTARKGGAAPAPATSGDKGAFSFLGRTRKGGESGEEWGFSALKVGGTTVLVLALAGVAIFLLSKIQRGRVKGGTRRSLELLETMRLGTRKRLHLAQLGHRTVVLAETDRELTLLLSLDEDQVADRDEPALPEEEEQEEPRREEPFKRVIRRRVAEVGR